jgi:hypothetical protein
MMNHLINKNYYSNMKDILKQPLSDDWLTPPEIINSLGKFDLDPCTPENMPWNTAEKMYTPNDNGLLMPWFGRVWLNPPYGKSISVWMNRMAIHKNGIALVFARTETKWFFDYIWKCANSLLFIKSRISFFSSDNVSRKFNAPAPSVLVSYDKYNKLKLLECNIIGKFIDLQPNYEVYFIYTDYSSESWKIIVAKALNKLHDEALLNEIYNKVIELAPSKVQNNQFYKEKIRQILQKHFNHIGPGKWNNN